MHGAAAHLAWTNILLACLETAGQEDAAEKLVYKAGVADQVFPEEMTNISSLKLLPQTECVQCILHEQQST